MRTTAKRVANRLRQMGYPILKVTEADPFEPEDGEVQITETVHIQVGSDYVLVVAEEGEGDDVTFLSYPAAATYEKLEGDLKSALKGSGIVANPAKKPKSSGPKL